MAITSESQIIDVVTIEQGCSIIEAAAADYVKCGEKVLEASEICTAEALSVENTTMQPSLEELGISIQALEGNLYDFTSCIRNAVSQIYTKQMTELNEYRARQAQAEQQVEQQTSNNN